MRRYAMKLLARATCDCSSRIASLPQTLAADFFRSQYLFPFSNGRFFFHFSSQGVGPVYPSSSCLFTDDEGAPRYVWLTMQETLDMFDWRWGSPSICLARSMNKYLTSYRQQKCPIVSFESSVASPVGASDISNVYCKRRRKNLSRHHWC